MNPNQPNPTEPNPDQPKTTELNASEPKPAAVKSFWVAALLDALPHLIKAVAAALAAPPAAPRPPFAPLMREAFPATEFLREGLARVSLDGGAETWGVLACERVGGGVTLEVPGVLALPRAACDPRVLLHMLRRSDQMPLGHWASRHQAGEEVFSVIATLPPAASGPAIREAAQVLVREADDFLAELGAA